MSLDVSPDGKHVVFDMLGDIYVIPATGGDATRLTHSLPQRGDGIIRGQPLNVQPRFSPDGSRIVFVSDRDGADNIYVMNVDGSSVRQITTGRNIHSSPVWLLRGDSIAARRVMVRANAFVGSSGELVFYSLDGKSAPAG